MAIVLTTKLSRPFVCTTRVIRPRLIAYLDRNLEQGGKLTLICAPAGTGKTTLVTDWLSANDTRGKTDDRAGGSGHSASFRRQDFRTAWVSLDAGDNDPIRFWTYVLAAIATVDASLVEAARAMLLTPPASIEPMLALVVNAIFERMPLDSPSVL